MATDPADRAYELKNCSYAYRNHPCLVDINLQLHHHRFYGLIGPNGSGKTTLINLFTGTRVPSSGEVKLRGRSVHTYAKVELARQLSFVPQANTMDFEYTVEEVVMMGRHPYIGRFQAPRKEDLQHVRRALATLDIEHLQHRCVTQLSGGERQRVIVARALAQHTGIMVLDEATASLDVRHAIDIMQALRHKVTGEGTMVIAAIHDLDLAAAFCDELIVMHQGSVAATGKVDELLTAELLRQIFSVEAEVVHQAGRPPHIRYGYPHVTIST
ncbi:MAG: ABC transporter ATP-binding protein [Desulfopila sp.]